MRYLFNYSYSENYLNAAKGAILFCGKMPKQEVESIKVLSVMQLLVYHLYYIELPDDDYTRKLPFISIVIE